MLTCFLKYVHSSATDFAGLKGILDMDVLERPPFGVRCTYVAVLLWLCHEFWYNDIHNISLHVMSTGYQIYDKAGSYYLTFQVVDWVDIFTRKVYRDIILDSFDYCRKHKVLHIWTHENHAVELLSHSFTCQKMAYIHENPVRRGWVEKVEDWMYSSQRNYSGLESLIEIDIADI